MSHRTILKKIPTLLSFFVLGGLQSLMAEDVTPPADGARGDGSYGAGGSSHGNKSVWEIHWPLFLGVLIFIAVSLIVSVVCCVLLKVCKKRRFKQPEKIVADEPEFRATYAGTQSQKPMFESVATGDPLPADEENGWIIPLDQMTPEELDQPEVPLSKV